MDKDDSNLPYLSEYQKRIEEELTEICKDILSLLDRYLIPVASESSEDGASEATVFYYKMKGDYYRYLSEFQSVTEKESSSVNALEAYRQASNIATSALAPTHPIRLGLALNFSV